MGGKKTIILENQEKPTEFSLEFINGKISATVQGPSYDVRLALNAKDAQGIASELMLFAEALKMKTGEL